MNRKKILFVGHDFKFLKSIISHFSQKEEFDIDVFTYSGHKIVDHKDLAAKLPNADIIFCEWGLGNLSWLSKNKFPDQKIIVRIHLQEFVTPFLNETNWQCVNKVILVGPHMLRKFKHTFPEIKDKCKLIYNIIDTNSFNLPKTKDAVFNIGSLGVLPSRKAPHLGLELLIQLKKIDKRYKYIIKSKKPEELDWLWKRDEERKYYTDFFENIKKMGLEDSVIWDEYGSDVQEWFQKIQYTFSPSDFESFHMAIPEGMASGAIPIIRNWEGADQLYPKKFIFSDVQEAAKIIKKYSEKKSRERETSYLKNYVQKHFGLDVILNQYEQIFNELAVSIDANQQKITLRSIYNDISEEKNKNTEASNKRIHESENKISALNKELSEKNRTIKDYYQTAKEKESIIHELKSEIASKSQKIESIISVADEMKEQLSAGREREKQQIKELSELKILQEEATQKAAHVTAQLDETKEHLQNTQQQLNASKLRENQKNQIIEKQNQAIESKTKESEILNSQLAKKDLSLQQIQIELTECENKLRNKKEFAETLENSISVLEGKLRSLEHSVKGKQMQIIEQKKYINYLEKRVFNKMIRALRKIIKRQSSA